MHAAVDDDGSIVGGAGAFSFRMTVPGGVQLPTRRRDGRRRPADASPARHPPLDDARPARRRSRAGRADRDALGLRGDDLRPLRLRARLAEPQFDVAKSNRTRSARASRHGRPGAPRRLRRGGEAAATGLRRRSRASRPACTSVARPWWENRMLGDPPEIPVRRRAQALRRARGRRRAAGLRDLPPARRLRRPRAGDDAAHDRGDGRDARGDRVDLALPPRHRLDEDGVGRLQPVDHPLLPAARPPELSRAGDLATGSGCGSSTSARRSPARGYAGEGSVVLDVRDEFCPWNEGRWRVEGGRGGQRTNDDADLALDVSDLGSVYLGGFTFRELQRAGRVEELTEGAVYLRGRDLPHGRRALVPRDLLTVVLWTIRCESAWRMSSGALE